MEVVVEPAGMRLESFRQTKLYRPRVSTELIVRCRAQPA